MPNKAKNPEGIALVKYFRSMFVYLKSWALEILGEIITFIIKYLYLWHWFVAINYMSKLIYTFNLNVLDRTQGSQEISCNF